MKLISCSTLLSCFLIAGCHGARPGSLGVVNGKLAPCPNSLNCVSSQAEDEKHRVEPLRYESSRSEAKAGLLGVIRSMKRARIAVEEDDYIHAEFKSALWRFIDDVEFYFVHESKIIHVRSASRVGRSDLGVNRKRIERIRKQFLKGRD